MHMWKHLAAAAALVLSSLAFAAEPAAPIDVNTASAEVLAEAIDGVGLKRARAIVEFREDDTHRVRYVRRPFQSEPDFGAASVNYAMKDLLARSEAPQ